MITDRVLPWQGIGTEVSSSNSVVGVLDETGMNWDVASRKVWFSDDEGEPQGIAPNVMANVRLDTNEVLGIVSGKYEIIQNREAYSFLDYMIPEGLIVHAGGVINNRKLWLTGEFGKVFPGTPDETVMYIVFTNTHDGKGSVRVCLTPIRCACQNTLNFAFRNAYRSWSISHVGDIQGKLLTAEETIRGTIEYTEEFEERASILMDTRLPESDFQDNLVRLFPLESGAHEQRERIVMERRAAVETIYKNAPDLGRGTAWDFINAVSDFAMHHIPDYNETLYRTSNFNKIMQGNPLIDSAYKMII